MMPDIKWAKKLVFISISWSSMTQGTCFYPRDVPMAIAAPWQWRPKAEIQHCSAFCSLRIKLQKKSMLFSSSTTWGASSSICLCTGCVQDLLSWCYSLS